MTPITILGVLASLTTIVGYTVYMTNTENNPEGFLYRLGDWYDAVFFNHGSDFYE